MHAQCRLCSFYGEDDTGSNMTHKQTVLLTVFFMGKKRMLTPSAYAFIEEWGKKTEIAQFRKGGCKRVRMVFALSEI